MKEKEVPQDQINMFNGKPPDVMFAVDENGNYIRVKSAGWEPKNEVLRQAWEEVNENIEEARRKVATGEKSAIFYFMHKNIMDIRLLAEYTGLWRWQVKRHLKPGIFKKLSDKTLEKYKTAFRLDSIEEIKKFDGKEKERHDH
jgi:hypothetical protein